MIKVVNTINNIVFISWRIKIGIKYHLIIIIIVNPESYCAVIARHLLYPKSFFAIAFPNSIIRHVNSPNVKNQYKCYN